MRFPSLLRAGTVLACFAVGCSQSSGDDATSLTNELQSTDFEPLLECDEHAAVLERDPRPTTVVDLDEGGAERTSHDLRFVVRDRAIVEHLSSRVAHVQNTAGEVVLRGSLRADAPFDFFEDWSIGAPSTRPDGDRVRVSTQVVGVAHRVHGEADRVRIVFNQTTLRRTCSTYWEEQRCAFDAVRREPGRLTVERTDEPVADWVFTCRAPPPAG